MKSKVFQTIGIVGLVVLYLISSPSTSEKWQAWKQNFFENSEKHVPLANAQTQILPSQISMGTSSANIDPYPEPEPMTTSPISSEPPVEFIEIIDSCGAHFEGTCVNARSGPGVTYQSVAKLRDGVVLRKAGEVADEEGNDWYKIAFKENLRYPERVSEGWYVNANYARQFLEEDTSQLALGQTASTSKRIIVDLSKQTLYAYDDDQLFMEQKVSTGIKSTPTPRGTFSIFKKTPSRYMQGPLAGISTEYYDLPGVPWNLYFTTEGAVIHGAYWHNSFGNVYSHGCVNLPLDKAEELYRWADLGTRVTILD